MRHAPQPLLWSPPASAAAAMSQRHPSASPQIDRSALKVGFRSENAAGAAADPSGDASSFLCSPMRREATRGARPAVDDEGSAGRASAGPVARSARGTCRRPDDSRRAAADGGAVGAAAAAPPVGGALVVAWAALRRRWGRPGSGGSLPPHHFEMPADHFEMPAQAARGPRYSFFYKAKFEPIEETQAGRLEALRDGRCSPSARPDFRIARGSQLPSS